MTKERSISKAIGKRKKREQFMRRKLGSYYERAMAVFTEYGEFFPNTVTKLALMAAGDQQKMEKSLQMFEKYNGAVNTETTRRLIRKIYQEVFGIKTKSRVTTEAA